MEKRSGMGNWLWIIIGAILFYVGSVGVHPQTVYYAILDFLRDPGAILAPFIFPAFFGTLVAVGAVIVIVFGLKEIGRSIKKGIKALLRRAGNGTND